MTKRGRHGWGSIRQRGRTWEVALRVGGAQRLTRTANTRAEAESILADLVQRRQRGGFRSGRHGGKQTLSTWTTQWFERKSRTVRAKTREFYRTLLYHRINPVLGLLRLDRVEPEDVAAFYDQLAKAGLSPRTQRATATVLRRVLEDAVALRLIPDNPARSVKVQTGSSRDRSSVWERADLLRFLQTASGHHLYPFYYLLAVAGLRVGEACGLRWSSVNLDEGHFRVERALVEVNGHLTESLPKTAAGRRTIRLSAEAVEVLRAHRDRQDAQRAHAGSVGYWQETGHVFTSSIGTPLDPRAARRDFQTLRVKAGVTRIRLHDLRHGLASMLIADGERPEVVGAMLGHANPGVTMSVYRHILREERGKATPALADLLATPGPRAQG